MDESKDKIQEDKEYTNTTQDLENKDYTTTTQDLENKDYTTTTQDLEDINRRQQQYKALVDFFKKDMEIKTDLINLAPNPIDEYSEDSRMDYIDKLFSELKDMEFKFKSILKNFNMESQLQDVFNAYFDKSKNELSELGYGSKHESLIKIYHKIFADIKPDLIEKAKQTFGGYKVQGGMEAIPTLMNDVGTINELLHITHSSIINDDKLLQSMPILGTKTNSFDYNIVLYGEENEVSKKIFENFPLDLDVGYTDIVSMKDRTLMMVRDRGHALTIDINSSDKDIVDVTYFIPKICNLDMVKALKGINQNGISPNGASGFYVSKYEDISENIFDFISKVPTDMDMPEIRSFYESNTFVNSRRN